jgi:hypothetical protein
MTFTSGSGLARIFCMSCIAFCCLVPAASNAQSEQTFELTTCHAGQVKTVFQDKDVTLMSAEGRGIVMSNQGSTPLDNSTFQVIATVRIAGQTLTEVGYVKLTDPDGDVILMEMSRSGAEHTSTFFHGTGKWKGISGSGKGRYIAFRRVQPDWAAACSKSLWTIKLPAK